MADDLSTSDAVVRAIIEDIVSTLPDGLLSSYRNPPGRNPPQTLQEVSRTLSQIDDESAKIVILDVVDATIFSVLHLIDVEFKQARIKCRFEKSAPASPNGDSNLAATYRSLVDPGGQMGKLD